LAGKVGLGTLASAGSTHVCLGGSGGQLAHCSSSIRYKTEVENYTRGLDLISKLRPVAYNWKTDGKRDIGFIAEEVNQIEPLLNVFNKDGEIEGVKYDQLTTALVNGVNEQQGQIEQLREQVKLLREQVGTLRAMLCEAKPPVAKNDKEAEVTKCQKF
jgi:hypothetical protein